MSTLQPSRLRISLVCRPKPRSEDRSISTRGAGGRCGTYEGQIDVRPDAQDDVPIKDRLADSRCIGSTVSTCC